MIRASEKENVIPRAAPCGSTAGFRLGMGQDHVLSAVRELLGDEHADGGYSIEFSEEVVGNSSPPDSRLRFLRDFVERTSPVRMLPIVLPGFTDSHWFRKAFPECVAYGFFPQRAMTRFDTMPLIHAPDERIASDDIELASRFFSEACTGRAPADV